MAWTLVNHAAQQSATGNGITTAAIDTTGATLLVMAVGRQDTTDSGVSDSKGNTWTTAATVSGNSIKITLYYVRDATGKVGTGHTFSTGADSGSFPVMGVQAWSGNDTTQNRDQESAGSALSVGATVQPGSVTPSQANELLVSACAYSAGGPVTVGSGFTVTDSFNFSGGAAYGITMCYLLQTTAAAVNPTFTGTNTTNYFAGIDTFKIASSGGDTPRTPPVGAGVLTGVTAGRVYGIVVQPDMA